MKSKTLRRHLLGPTLSLFALASFSEVALAKQPSPRESYPATEDSISPGQMEPTPVEVTSSVQIKTRVHAPSVRKQRASQTVIIPSESKPAAVAAATAPAFDPVPTSQAEPIIKRLKLVEELIRKYGRAYDYRNHTVKELDGILASLENKPQAKTAAPPIAQPKAAAAQAGEAGEGDLKSLPTPVELDSNSDTVDEI